MVSGLGTRPGSHLQIGLPTLLTIQTAPGPQGEGLHGSGFSMQRLFWQTKPERQSGSTTHSGPHPVIVSGLGMSPSWHRQMGLPNGLGEHVVPGPQGEGLQGSTGLTGGGGGGMGTSILGAGGPSQMLTQPLKQQRPLLGQSKSRTPGLQHVLR